MREPEVAAEVQNVSSGEGTFRTLVRFLPGQNFHHLFPEMTELVEI
jgi:hypothetical protein